MLNTSSFWHSRNRKNCCIYLAFYACSMGQCLLAQQCTGITSKDWSWFTETWQVLIYFFLIYAYLCISDHICSLKHPKSHTERWICRKSLLDPSEDCLMLRLWGNHPQNCSVLWNVCCEKYKTTFILILRSELIGIIYTYTYTHVCIYIYIYTYYIYIYTYNIYTHIIYIYT